jgi:hypothetical protein
MIHRLVVGSAVMITSFFTTLLTTNTIAQGSEIVLITSVSTNCFFFNSLPGELAVNSGLTVLSSENGGTPATVQIDCNGAANLTISKPQQTSIIPGTTIFSPVNLSATATTNGLSSVVSISSESPNNVPLPLDGDGEIKGEITVNMLADNGGNKILPGDYNFTVTLTATP